MEDIVLTPAPVDTPEEAKKELTPAAMIDPQMILAFMFAGDVTLTFRNVHSMNHYTYLIREGKEQWKGRFFVYYLSGSDNESDYTYMGWVVPDWKTKVPTFRTTAKSKVTMQSQVVMVFSRVLELLLQGKLPKGLEIWHEGRCARCHRKLTDAQSIADGFGPICIKLSAGLIAGFAPILPAQTSDNTTAAYSKPRTPAAILAAVNEDPKIQQLADEMWAKNPANPVNKAPVVPAEPLPVDAQAAVELAKTQGWTVEEATIALSRRKIVNLNLKKSDEVDAALDIEVVKTTHKVTGDLDYPSKQGQATLFTEQVIEELAARVNMMKNDRPDDYTMDGIMNEDEAFAFWYKKFQNDAVGV